MTGFSLRHELEQHGVSRRDFLGFCASMAAILGLPESATETIAATVENEARPILVWLEFQDCAGNTESFLRAAHPTVADLILDSISLNYHETLMAAAGSQAESALAQTISANKGKYIALVEGSIPIGRRRRLLHDRWTFRARYRPRGLRQRCCDRRGRHLRLLRRHSGGAPEPDRSAFGRRRRAGRTKPHQHVGLSGQCRKHHGTHCLLHDDEGMAAARSLSAAAVRLRQDDPRQLRAARTLRQRQLRRAVGRRRPSPRLLPVQGGMQGAGYVAELPDHQMERRHQLAGRLRTSLRRLRRTEFLGYDDAILQAPAGDDWRRYQVVGG